LRRGGDGHSVPGKERTRGYKQKLVLAFKDSRAPDEVLLALEGEENRVFFGSGLSGRGVRQEWQARQKRSKGGRIRWWRPLKRNWRAERVSTQLKGEENLALQTSIRDNTDRKMTLKIESQREGGCDGRQGPRGAGRRQGRRQYEKCYCDKLD